jgi:hypothetical protein
MSSKRSTRSGRCGWYRVETGQEWRRTAMGMAFARSPELKNLDR